MSHIVSGLTQKYRIALPIAHNTAENVTVWTLVSCPLAVGRHEVRAILASICCSTTQLSAAAAPATSQMPAVAVRAIFQSGRPGTASSMPMTAQNTIN